MFLEKFEKGTNYVSKNEYALVHKDEMIIPNKNASKIRSNINNKTPIKSEDNSDSFDEDFWINTFMPALANVVKDEYGE